MIFVCLFTDLINNVYKMLDCTGWSGLIINEQIIWTAIDGNASCLIWYTSVGFAVQTDKDQWNLSQIKSLPFVLSEVHFLVRVNASTKFLPVHMWYNCSLFLLYLTLFIPYKKGIDCNILWYIDHCTQWDNCTSCTCNSCSPLNF